MGFGVVLLWALLAAPPKAPAPTPLPIVTEGFTAVFTVRGSQVNRFSLDIEEKGTVFVIAQPIQGRAPKMYLRNDENLLIRRSDKHGQLWSRPPAGTKLFLEVKQPRNADSPSTYLLKVFFEADRPKELRHQRRPSRPGEIVRVPVGMVGELDRVSVDGIVADYKIVAPDVLVTIPAFARRGDVELLFQSGATKRHQFELIGVEPPSEERAASCAGLPGCVRVVIDQRVGSKWLTAIARILDADLVRHDQKTGVVELRLRLPQTESFALETLSMMKGVVSARRERLTSGAFE